MNMAIEVSSKVYVPGSTIEGALKCIFRTKTEIESATIAFKGMERVHCGEKCKLNQPFDYESECIYYKEDKIITSDDGMNKKFNKGSFSYPFLIELPQELPSTYIIPSIGWINYTVEATVHILHGASFQIKRTTKDIIIDSSLICLDNYNPKYHEPYSSLSEFPISLYCLKNGTIQLQLDFPKRAFTVNEVINFRISLDNKSKLKINKIKIFGYGRIFYRFESDGDFLDDYPFSPKMNRCCTVYKHQRGYVGDINSFEVAFQMPDYWIPNFQGCRLFEFIYELEIRVHLEFCTVVSERVHTKLGHFWHGGDAASSDSSISEEEQQVPRNSI